MTIELRSMQETDLAQGFRLSQQVSWPHRYQDWQQALSLGEGVVAENQHGVVGCALLWQWGEARSTLGLVIVDPACQGQGIGKQLMQALLEKAAGGNVRLHATEMGKGLYQKYGFVVQCSVFQHQTAQLPEISAPRPDATAGETVRPLRREELPALIEQDYQAHGLYRPALWQDLLQSADALLVLENPARPLGYMVIRKFGRGHVIGPMLAADESSARKLFGYAAAQLTGQFVRIDTYGNTAFSDWLSECGLPVVDVPLMMVRGTPWQRKPEAMADFSFMSQAMG
ncbi:GNAT family N-acetyltransferase [Tatumella punctata]|uniref:GNAT family N-acetyltransferase n=1 Tax=Tatumella punctata TaxID=399969 RepID=A0ABW1VKF8_9GAMM